MNDDLETRLRDALDGAARTIPDHPPTPGLPVNPPVRRPARRTYVALGAAAAVLLVVGVPIAAREMPKGSGPEPATAPCPEPTRTPPSLPNRPKGDGQLPWSDRLPAGPPPAVPYTLTDAKGGGYLQDGDTRVTLRPGTFVRPLDRLACGWLAVRGNQRYAGAGDLGVLLPNGDFRTIGRADWAVLSPDGSRVAYSAVDRSDILIAEVATGRELDRLPAVPGSVVVGWNPAGVWLGHPGTEGLQTVWRPGSTPQQVRHEGHDFFTYRTTDRMLVQPSASSAAGCVRVVTLGSGGRLDEVMRRCGQKHEAILSPDGKLLVTGDGKGYRVPDDTPTELAVPELNPNGRWEDNTHFLLEANLGDDNAGGRRVLARCDAVIGSCERIYDDNRRLTLQLAGH